MLGLSSESGGPACILNITFVGFSRKKPVSLLNKVQGAPSQHFGAAGPGALAVNCRLSVCTSK